MTTETDTPKPVAPSEGPNGQKDPAAPAVEVPATATHIVAAGIDTEHASAAPVAPAPNEEAKPEPPAAPAAPEKAPSTILVLDIGGTKVKMLATGHTHPRKAESGRTFTPARLVEVSKEQAQGWDYEAVTIGYPGLVGTHGPRSEPGNLGPGWVGFDFAAAFGKPVKIVNDAAMQALGSYDGGRMLFLGLGTGLGSALIAGHVVVPLELGQMMYDGKRSLGEVLGRRGYRVLGKSAWRKAVNKSVTALMRAFVADYVVIGGGNAKNVKELPPGARLGHNLAAFRGGFRVWNVQDVWVQAAPGGESPKPSVQEALRML